MTEQAKVPAIRFAGFTDPWEQRKFSNLTDRVSMQSSDPDLPQVEYEDIVSGEGTLNKDLRDKEGGKTGIKFYAGDVLYGKLRPYLMNWLYPQFNGVAVGDFWVLRATECDSSFLYRLVQTGSFQRLANVSSGSKMPRADWNLISQSFFAVPADYAEQRVIAKSLAELDNLITLHQRKYDKLVVFKKSMLEKMFPKDGESVPEIRFAGFTDPWEQRKLGELEKDATLYMGRGRVISAKDMSNTPGTFPVYSSSALDNGRMGAYGKYMFNQELITWSIDGGGAVFYRRKHRFSVTNVSGYIAVNPEKINCKFLAYAMSLAHSRIKFDYTVKAHPSVIRSLYTMGIPISLQEQQVIGSFFSRLDNLITLHQRKLELLRNIKKSLLDKMFV